MAVVMINSNVDMIDLLLKHGANLDRQSNAGRTALMEAVTREGTLVVRYLLAKGANVNIKAPSGHTALILAAYNGRLEIAKLLLSAGADPFATATDSSNPDDQAGRYDATHLALQQGHDEVAKLIETAKTRRANAAR
jgi:ankyrin repeat protein